METGDDAVRACKLGHVDLPINPSRLVNLGN